jgi:ABC-2 type transport system ATP-binding protein
MTAREYLSLFADLFEVANAARRIDSLLSKVDLERFRNKRVKEFSRGMLQKLSIIRALLPDPDILFLDEPISGLDPIGIKQVRDLIVSENREGRTIFISSHQLSEMEKICHRVAIIFRGKLMVEDIMTNLLSRMTPAREIHVELESVPETTVARLRDLPFVRDASALGTTLLIRLSKEGDFRKALSEQLIRDGLVPLSISEKIPSLEEAFITITQENIDLLARGGKR